MPSGAKKRKAARRKKEIVHGAHPDHEGHAQGSGSSGEEEAEVTSMDGSNGAGDHETDASAGLVEEKEAAAPESDEVSVELTKGEESAAASVPASEEEQEVSVELIQAVKSEAVVLAEAPPEATEEVVEVAEAAAKAMEASSGVDSSVAPETEERALPASDNSVSKEQREISCSNRATSELVELLRITGCSGKIVRKYQVHSTV